ncbi:MAG: 50S ribosomal protein L15 [Thermodesulfobacteriota bacterium]
MLERLKPPKGAVKKRKRVGRGNASGQGRCSGRGEKGQKSRSGGSIKPGFEGGQMPLQRRLPKRGFTNIFRVESRILNVSDLKRAFSAGDVVDVAALVEKGVIKNGRTPVKVLGSGEIDIALTVKANFYSKSAIEKITAAGGKAEVASKPTSEKPEGS